MNMIIVVSQSESNRVESLRKIVDHMKPNALIVQVIEDSKDRMTGNAVNLIVKNTNGLNIPNMVKEVVTTAESRGHDLIVSTPYFGTHTERSDFINTTASGYDVTAIVCDDTVISDTEGFANVMSLSEFIN